MNRVVLLLAVTTLTFTATAIYYAHALRVEKARHSLLQLQNTTSGQNAPQGGMDSTGATALTGNIDAKEPVERPDPAEAALARHHLDQLQDPARRAEKKRDIVGQYRQGMTVEGRLMGLSSDELDRYLEARAERILENQQRVLECQLGPSCDAKALQQSLAQAANSEVRQMQADLLGPERYARYLALREASRERSHVTQMRRQLTAPHTLSDAQAELLVMALAAERIKFDAEVTQNGQKVLEGHPFRQTGIPLRSGSAARAADAPAERMESATRYNQRIIDRAATVLTSGQMTEFKRLQEHALQEYEEFLQEEAIRESALRAATSKPGARD